MTRDNIARNPLEAARHRVERARVRFFRDDTPSGQGVVVPGGFIVTACHVIRWDGRGKMALGAHFLEDVEIGGRRCVAEVVAAEPVADIAVLGEPDVEPEWEAFTEAIAAVAPVLISTDELRWEQWVAIGVLTASG